MIKTVLIVGGSGYLGRHLYPNLLASGYNVTLTGTNENKLSLEDNIKYLKLDFSDEKTFCSLTEKKYDLVLILASSISGIGNKDLSNKDLDINVFNFNKFLIFLQNAKISNKYIYTSSMTVYSDANISPVKEDGLLEPINVYGLSKLMAENLFSFFCRVNHFNGVILRLPGLYGGDRKGGVVYNAIKKLKNNEIFTLQSEGLGFWETMHIKDLNLLFQSFLNSYIWQEKIDVYNFSYGKEIDFYDTIMKIGEKLGKATNLYFKGDRGYKKLFLSNSRIKNVCNVTVDFEESLDQYIDEV